MYSEGQLTEILRKLLTMPAETEVVEFKRAENSFPDAVLETNYKTSRPSLDEMKKRIAERMTNRITFDEIELIRAQATAKIDWSAEIVDGATLEDLDAGAIRKARELYSDKHPKLKSEIDGWSDKQFLNNAKVTRNGRITNTAIILLGKPQSEVFISPAVSKIRWIVKDHLGVERDYEVCSCPMILAVEHVASKIRNLKYRFIDPAKDTIFPEEMDTYEPYVIREALNNAVAHQSYAMGGMVNVVKQISCFGYGGIGNG